jgi:hypothetical protein
MAASTQEGIGGSYRHTGANKAREMKSGKHRGGLEDRVLWRTRGRPKVPFHDQ